MILRHGLKGFLLVVALGCLAGQAQAQCIVTNTGVTTVGQTISVYKSLQSSGQCTLLSGSNAICQPSVPAMIQYLAASATTAAPTPRFCHWTCACDGRGSITIDGGDGLPVELMEFGVEDGTESGDSGDGERSAREEEGAPQRESSGGGG